MQMNEQIAMHTTRPTKTLKKSNSSKDSLSYKKEKEKKKRIRNPCSTINQNLRSLTAQLQPKRVLRRLPVPPNPLATRQILVLHILLVALPLVRVFGDVLHAFGGFAVRAADGTCDVADGGLEGFVEDLADGVADDAEEALGCG